MYKYLLVACILALAVAVVIEAQPVGKSNLTLTIVPRSESQYSLIRNRQTQQSNK